MRERERGRLIALAILSPLLEKNLLKTAHMGAAYVVSMTRLIVLAFAVVMLRELWVRGVAAWPQATLAMAIVLALPIVGALERVKPEAVVGLARALVGRFGAGAVSTEPSKFDDHRND